MKKLIISIILIATTPIFGQSSCSDGFELNLIINRNNKDFGNIQLYYISSTGMTSCQVKIDSLENNNYSNIKLFGRYSYFGGANEMFPTFVISETKNNVVQNYLIKLDFTPKIKSKGEAFENRINQIAISLNPSQPLINIVMDQNKKMLVGNYELLSEAQSIYENKNVFTNLLTWTKIISN